MESMTDCAFSCPISDDESNKGSALFLDIPCRGGERRWQRMVFVLGFVPLRGGKDGRRYFFTLVVIKDISLMIATAVVGFAHAHGVMREVDIAVVT